MAQILICWLGATDLKAATEGQEIGLGPIAQAVKARGYDEIALISNYGKGPTDLYIKWLQEKTLAKTTVHYESLSSPTNFGEIYQIASRLVSDKINEYGSSVFLTFHLSPGTPAMAAVWIILSKTRFPAELIESSREHGVRTASVPFDISAEFIPDLLRRPDERLEKLTGAFGSASGTIEKGTVWKRLSLM